MESKKINQLATELTPVLSDLTIIGDPSTGISKKITLSQMASLFTGTVEEYPNLASFPLVGTADTIYIALDTNVLYRWDTGLTSYVELSPNIINSLVFSDANGFDGNISLVGSTATLTITTALTTGSVPFIGASGALSQDNANLFFDDTNNRLGINTNAPTTAIDVFGSGIIGRLNGTSTNNSFLGFASAGSNKWSIGNVQSDHRFRIYSEANTAELVSVLQTGEFGIGIANPTTKFHIDGGASALIANLDANVSVAKSISFRSDNSNRINLEVSGTESGSNAGANFFLRSYSDAGALLSTPLTIIRSTGNATFTGDIALNGASGTRTLEIQSNTSGNAVLSLVAAGSNSGAITYNRSTSELIFGNSSATSALKIASDGISTFSNNVIASKFIVGTDLGYSLNITGSGFAAIIQSTGSSSNIPLVVLNNATSGVNNIISLQSDAGLERAAFRYDRSGNRIQLVANGNGLLVTGITSFSTNVGLGVLPSAWASGWVALQVGTASLHNTGSFSQLANNIYFDGTNYRYINTSGANRIGMNTDGEFFVGTAASGTGGSIATMITRLSINGSSGAATFTSSLQANQISSIVTSGVARVNIGDDLVSGGAILNLRGVAAAKTWFVTSNYNLGGGLEFLQSTANGGVTPSGTTLMALSSSGNLLLGTSTDAGYKAHFAGGGSYTMLINQSGGTAAFIPLAINHNVTSGGAIKLINFSVGGVTDVGSITTNASTTSYNTTSDYRLKEDLKDFDGLDILSKIKFYDFAWKKDNTRTTGVIAHELAEIVPYAVVNEKDEIKENGDMIPQGVDYSKLVAIQGRAIQQLEQRIKQLEK